MNNLEEICNPRMEGRKNTVQIKKTERNTENTNRRQVKQDLYEVENCNKTESRHNADETQITK